MQKNKGLTGKFILFSGGILLICVVALSVISINFAAKNEVALSDNYKAALQSSLTEGENSHTLLIKRKSENLVQLIAQSAANLMLNYDYDTLRQIAQFNKDDKSIAYIAFYDQNGSLIAGDKNKTVKDILTKEIVSGTDSLGHVEVGLDFSEVTTHMAVLAKKNDALIVKINAAMKHSIHEMTITLGGVAIAGIILLSLTLYGLFRRIITNPLNSTMTMLKDIAEGEGDLAGRLKIATRDEIGRLAGFFNLFVEKLQKIISEINQQSQTLHESAKNLDLISRNFAQGASDMSSRSSEAVNEAKRISVSMNSIVEVMGDATSRINTVVTTTQDMSTRLQEMVNQVDVARNKTEDAVKQSGNSTAKIHELGQAAEEISSVIETITAISDQTNLLALNATIEAARAGEAGKGFAVVANEIKSLAQETAKATHDISERLEAIRSVSGQTVTGIGTIAEAINKVNEIVTTLCVSMQENSLTSSEISANISETSTDLKEILQLVNEANYGSGQVANNIAEVNTIAERVTRNSSELADNSTSLETLANQIQQRLSTFKV